MSVNPETMWRVEAMIRKIAWSMPRDVSIDPLDLTPEEARRWGPLEILAEINLQFGEEAAWQAFATLPILTLH
jgi:hypothetical protein